VEEGREERLTWMAPLLVSTSIPVVFTPLPLKE